MYLFHAKITRDEAKDFRCTGQVSLHTTSFSLGAHLMTVSVSNASAARQEMLEPICPVKLQIKKKNNHLNGRQVI